MKTLTKLQYLQLWKQVEEMQEYLDILKYTIWFRSLSSKEADELEHLPILIDKTKLLLNQA